MRPPLGPPPGALSAAEQAIMTRIRRAQWFVFLRHHRHVLFSESFQHALGTLYKDGPQGQSPIPPAPLALATLLQASRSVSEDEVMEATTMERRWQMGLDCLDGNTPPFSKGTLVTFRHHLLAQEMDRRLLERPVEIAAASGSCGPRQWRAALDSSPRWGAGRGEDTYNLLGHALRKAVRVIARQQGRGLTAVAGEAGAAVIAGASVQAALALDWDAPSAPPPALTTSLDALQAVEPWRDTQPLEEETPSRAVASLAVAPQGCPQDLTPPPAGTPTMGHGVAADRRMSVDDAEMRHGRKSRSRLVDGYKRHGLRDLESQRMVAGGVPPANVPEASVTDAIAPDRAAQKSPLQAWHIDRASWASTLGQQRTEDRAIFCQAWPVRPGPYVPTRACQLD